MGLGVVGGMGEGEVFDVDMEMVRVVGDEVRVVANVGVGVATGVETGIEVFCCVCDEEFLDLGGVADSILDLLFS